MSFLEARKIVRKLKLNTQEDWTNYCKKKSFPKNIPKKPDGFYKNEGWISYGDWLGTGRVASHMRKYKSYEDAREFVRKLNLKTTNEWNDYIKKNKIPHDIPKNPSATYFNNGWISMGD